MGTRIRPHIEGNFSTIVYIPVVGDNAAILQKIAAHISTNIFTDVTIVSPEEYHVSLSRPVSLKSHLIDVCLDDLRGSLSDSFREITTLYLSPEVKLYSSYDGSAGYSGVPLDLDASPRCIELIRIVDSVFQKFGMDEYFEPPSPHVSLCYGPLVEPTPPGRILDVRELALDELGIALNDLRIDFRLVIVQIGNSKYEIPL